LNLRIPGPTPVPESVLAAMNREMINHRGPEFAALIARITDSLKRFYRTTDDVLVLTASGTGALEASVVNTLSPGDPVLGVEIGWFGERIADIAQVYGADVPGSSSSRVPRPTRRRCAATSARTLRRRPSWSPTTSRRPA
jgi:aspartate aminotransferase-like enzyme